MQTMLILLLPRQLLLIYKIKNLHKPCLCMLHWYGLACLNLPLPSSSTMVSLTWTGDALWPKLLLIGWSSRFIETTRGASLFIPFASQQYIHAIRFWANCMHIICAPYDVNNVNEPLAEMWNESMKVEKEAMEALDTWNFQERYKVETMERKSPHLPPLQERSSQHPFGIHHQRKWCASSWDHICSCAWSAGWSRHPPWPQVQRQQRDHLWPIAVSQFKWPSMVM